MEMLKHATGIEILAVPFRGDAQINAALIAGDVEVAVVPLATAVPLIQEGRIRGLAITGARRSPTRARYSDRRRKRRSGLCLQELAGLVHGGRGRPPRSSSASSRRSSRRWRCPTCGRGSPRWPMTGSAQTPAEFAAYYKDEIAKFTKVIADAKIPKQ